MSKTYLFYLQMEQENGDQLKNAAGESLQLIVPDGFVLERDADLNENYMYTIKTPEDGDLHFRIMRAIEPNPPIPMPSTFILRADGAPEGKLG